MRIVYSYKGTQRHLTFPPGTILLGRPAEEGDPDLDLSPDRDTSRRHATVREVAGRIWIVDLGSQSGTFVNGRRISVPTPVSPEDVISIGSTILQVVAGMPEGVAVPAVAEVTVAEEIPASAGVSAAAAIAAAAGAAKTDVVEISAVAAEPPPTAEELAEDSLYAEGDEEVLPDELSDALYPDEGEARIRLLAEVLALNPRRHGLYPFVSNLLGKLMSVITDAERGAVLMLDPVTQRLSVYAYVAPGDPAISQTLVRKAVRAKKPFLWRRISDRMPSDTMQQIKIKAGIYAPIIWQERVLGVLCLDSSTRDLAFTDADLKLIRSVANAAAATIIAFEYQQQLGQQTAGWQRLVNQFPPPVAASLIARTQHGGLFPQVEKSEVTLLWIAFSGLTMPPTAQQGAAALEWWHDHFDLVIDLVQALRGTIERSGDRHLLAVFGSPEADPGQHANAVNAALALLAGLTQLRDARRALGDAPWEVRMAVHSVEAWNGLFGTTERLIFRVLGEGVEHVAALAGGAAAFEVLGSRELQPRIASLVQSEPVSVTLKPGVVVEAFRIKAVLEPVVAG